MKTYRVTVLGLAHVHAPGMMAAFAGDPRAKLAACADLPPAMPSLSMAEGTRGSNLRVAVEKYGMRTYGSAKELLDRESADIVLSCAENARHLEVAELAASHRCHLVFEKPMAMSFDEARTMVRLMASAGKTLAVNWPSAWSGELHSAKALIDAGAIGRVLKLHYANSSSMGPFSYGQEMTEAEMAAEWWYQSGQGGGAFLDYCGYGCMTATYLIGARASGAYGMKVNLNAPFSEADDNGIITARFPGAVATIEGTWTAVHAGAETPQRIYGSEGTMAVYRDRIEIYRTRFGKRPDEIRPVVPLPESRRDFAKDLLNRLETGQPLNPMFDTPLNLDAMALLDAGIRSARSGCFESVSGEREQGL